MTPEPRPFLVVRQYDTIDEARGAWRRVRAEFYGGERGIYCSSVLCGPHATPLVVLVVTDPHDVDEMLSALGGEDATDPCAGEVVELAVQRQAAATGSSVREGVFDHVAKLAPGA